MSAGKSKVDYAAVEREFVTGDITLRALARREKMSNSSISDYARSHGWAEKRASFRDQVDEEYIRSSAMERARRLSRLADRSADVLEAILVGMAQQLVPPEGSDLVPVAVPIKDALEAIKMIQLLRGEATERREEKVVNAHIIDPRLLGFIDNLARRGSEPKRVGESGPVALIGTEEAAS